MPGGAGSIDVRRRYSIQVPQWVRRTCGSSLFLGTLVGIASWPGLVVTPAPGLDPSWQTGLNMALPQGLDFGGDLIWTYGPLGFVKVPQVTYGTYSALAAAYTIVVQIGLGTTLVWGARRTFPVPVAVVISLLAAMVLGEPIVAVALVWCIAVLGGDAPAPVRSSFPYAAGALSAIELLAKLNIGLLVLAISAVSVVAMDAGRRRNLAAFAASLLAGLAALWFATGQGIDDLRDQAAASLAVVGGYSSAMGVEARAPGPAALRYGFDLSLLGASAVAGYVGSRGRPPVRRIATLVVIGVAGFALWKQAVVRHEWPREAGFLTLLAATLLAFDWRTVRVPGIASARAASAAVLAAVAGGAVVFVIGLPRPALDVLDPIDRVDRAITQSSDLLVPAEREEARNVDRLRTAFRYAVDRKTLRLLGDTPVHVEPWEASLAWAYDLEWRPLPVFQPYLAYEPELDRRNADALASGDGPQRILRHSVGPGGQTLTPSLAGNSSRANLQALNSRSIDDRYGPYDAPAAKLAMLCHFEPARTTRTFEVLRRVPDRCGEARPLATVVAEYDEPIEVPRPPRSGDVVIARVEGMEPAGIERLQAFLFRADRREIVFDDTAEYRFVPGTAEDGLIVSAPREVDFPRPFALAPNPRTIELRKDDGVTSASPELSVEFLALSVRPW